MTMPNETTPMKIASVADDRPVDLDPVRQEAYDWIVRFMAGHMTPADAAVMKAWYRQSPEHRSAYAEARRVWQSLGPITRESRRCADDRQVIPMARAAPRRSPAMPSRRLFLGGALAAASVACVAIRPPLDLWPSYTELMADYRTGAGERRQVQLSNHVALDLNTKTSIAVRTQSPMATEIEMLSGEAAISTAASESPLTVVAANGRVITTNAEFNLRCDGGQASISCLKGQLNVARDGQSMALTDGQQVTYGGQGMGAVAAIDPASITAWQQGVLTFDATPVHQVISELNRYRPGRIVLMNGDIGRRLLNARIKIAETDKIIVQIVQIFGAKARELPGGVVFLT
jgi:transmembrane sensor